MASEILGRLLVAVLSVGIPACECTRVKLAKEEPPPRKPTVLALGAAHTCALEQGRVTCWGDFRALPIGDDSRGWPRPPTAVPGLHGVTELKANGQFTCALRADKRVTCWGRHPGDPPGSSQRPAEVPGLVDVEALYSAEPLCVRHSDQRGTCQIKDRTFELPQSAGAGADGESDWCVVDAAGVVQCATSQSKEPKRVSLPGRAKGLSVSMAASCAVIEGGDVYCWGDLAGMGFSPNQWGRGPESPMRVGLGRPATAVATGERRRCALLDTGEVDCWGHVLVPKDIAESGTNGAINTNAPSGAETLAVGDSHLCVATKDAIYCAGHNHQGQLGQGRRTGATAEWNRVVGIGAYQPRGIERLPDCAAASGCRPRCGSCPDFSLCAIDGTCQSVQREKKQRKANNGVVVWEALKWGDSEHEKPLREFVNGVAKSLWESDGDAEEKKGECSVTYISGLAANVRCGYYAVYAGAAHGMSAVTTYPLDLRDDEARLLRAGELLSTTPCREGVEAYALDSLLDQGAMWVVDGLVKGADYSLSLSREGLGLHYPLYSVQPYMGGMAEVLVPCTVLHAAGCTSPWIADMCR